MKKCYTLAMLLFVVFSAQAQRGPKPLKLPRQAKVDKDVWDVTDNFGMILKYEQPNEVAANLHKDAQLKLWSPEQEATEWEKQPKGGWLLSNFSRRTIEGANTGVFTVVIQDPQGKEIQRYKPESSVPKPFSIASVTVWTNSLVVPVRQVVEEGTKVFVIDEAEQLRFEYILRPQ